MGVIYRLAGTELRRLLRASGDACRISQTAHALRNDPGLFCL
jgi:hypothetical protein